MIHTILNNGTYNIIARKHNDKYYLRVIVSGTYRGERGSDIFYIDDLTKDELKQIIQNSEKLIEK